MPERFVHIPRVSLLHLEFWDFDYGLAQNDMPAALQCQSQLVLAQLVLVMVKRRADREAEFSSESGFVP
jgi:hypothetical protein